MNCAPKKPAGFKPGHMKMADGGYRKGSKDGGRVTGPGGPVADKVPAMYSDGEYVLPADTAKHIGYKRLDAIKDATHTPAAAQRMGFVPGMANGGLMVLDPERGASALDPMTPTMKQPPAETLAIGQGKSSALIPTEAGRSFTQPYGSSRDPKTIYQPTNTSPNFGLTTPAQASKSTALVPVGQPRGFTPPYAESKVMPTMAAPANPSFATGTSPEAAVYKAERAMPAPQAKGPGISEFGKGVAKNLGLGAAGFVAARAMSHIGENSTPAPAQARAPETQALIDKIPGGAGSTPTPAAQPYSWWTDTDAGRNVGNALNALGPMGSAISNSLRAGSGFARLAQAGGAVAGGMAMGGSGDYSTPAPAQPTAAPNPLMEGSNAGAGRGSVNPPLANSPAQEALQAKQAPSGNVQATRQPNGTMEFSGKDITGPVNYTGTTGFKPGGFGVSTPGEPGDGRRVMEMNNRLADQMRADREGTGSGQPFVYRQEPGQDWQSRLDRRNAEVSAGANMKTRARDIADNRIKAMDAHDLQGERLANNLAQADMQNTTARMGQRATAAQASASNQLAQQRLGMEQTTQGFQARGMQRLEAAQQALLDPKATPEQRKQAQSTLAALNGKTAADRMQTVNLPDTIVDGQKIGGGQALIRTREDGSIEQVPIGAQQAQAAQFKTGEIHKDSNGNRASWNGKEWVQIK